MKDNNFESKRDVLEFLWEWADEKEIGQNFCYTKY